MFNNYLQIKRNYLHLTLHDLPEVKGFYLKYVITNFGNKHTITYKYEINEERTVMNTIL